MSPAPSPTEPRSLLVSAAVILALLLAQNSATIVAGLPSSFPYSRALLATLTDIGAMLLLVGLAASRTPSQLIRMSGIDRSPVRPLLFAALLFGPALAVALALAPVAQGLLPEDLIWKGLAGPLFEELVYRGLAAPALVLLAGWRLVPAAQLPAAFFGLAHAYQGVNLPEVMGAVAITGIGAFWFAWLFWRWSWNLWPAILLHMGLNLLWMVFDLGESAVGGWLGNALRAAVVLGSILLTLRLVQSPRRAVPARA